MSLSVGSFASTSTGNWTQMFAGDPEQQALTESLSTLTADEFLRLTPKRYEAVTGQKLGVKEALQLKAAQKFVKHHINKPKAEIEKGLYVLLAILGLGFVGMGLNTNWSGNEWIIALVLAVLCVVPGIIYALVKMKDYY